MNSDKIILNFCRRTNNETYLATENGIVDLYLCEHIINLNTRLQNVEEGG